MARRYFGTDGIRGQANAWPMTAEVALRVETVKDAIRDLIDQGIAQRRDLI